MLRKPDKFAFGEHLEVITDPLRGTGEIGLPFKSAMNGLVGSYSNILALLGVTAYTKKKGRLRCHKRPKSREETPKEGSDSGWGTGGRYRIPYLR